MILKNCHIYDSFEDKEKTVDFILSEKIIAYGENICEFNNNSDSVNISSISPKNIEDINTGKDFVIDAGGMIIMPGGIDAHVHFDTPGFTDREDFYHGSMSAAAGGITTVIDMPCTSLPPVTNGDNFDIKYDEVKYSSVVDFCFYGGMNSSVFNNYKTFMRQLADKNVKGIKTYFISGMETFPKVTQHEFYKILEFAKEIDLPVLLHAEDPEIINNNRNLYSSDSDDYLRYCKTRSMIAEYLAVERAVNIANKLNGNLHIVHVASAKAAELINCLEGYNITYETCPHYLYFSEKDFASKGSALKTAPVVKKESDKRQLWQYVINGKCSFITSDHAACTYEEKSTGSFDKDYGGIPGTQTLLPVVFTEGFYKRGIPLKTIYEVCSVNPAKRYKLYPEKGSLQINTDADLTIIDPNSEYVFSKNNLLSKGKTTPFDGESFKGKVVMTILRGKIIYYANSGITINKGYGKYL